MKGIGPQFSTSWCLGDPNNANASIAGAQWLLTDAQQQRILPGTSWDRFRAVLRLRGAHAVQVRPPATCERLPLYQCTLLSDSLGSAHALTAYWLTSICHPADQLVVVPVWDVNITCSPSFEQCVAQSRALLSMPTVFEHKGESVHSGGVAGAHCF